MKVLLLSILSLYMISCRTSSSSQAGKNASATFNGYTVGKLLFQEEFNNGIDHWIVEKSASPHASVKAGSGKMVIDVDGGATVWFKGKLTGNIMIEYKRKVVVRGGHNDRLSDFNQFWMASDPKNKNLFTRAGVFEEYDSLLLYYVGFGGNTNTTTRFRKYTGDGQRVLHHDLTDQAHLLEANKEYTIRTIVYNGTTKFYVDDKEYFSFIDTAPLQEGFFGFRTTQSRQVIDNFKIYALK